LSRVSNKISSTIGLPPGTLIYTGKKRDEKVKISLIDYDEKHFKEQEIGNIMKCIPFKDKPTVTWINIDGIHDVRLVEEIGKCFDLHPLVLEDILTSDQRPKVEEFERHLFLVLKMLQYDEKEQEIISEQVSLILGPSYVLSFQEREGDVFTIIRDRIRKDMGRIRKMPSDYLAYALIDAIVDNYFSILEKIGEKIGDLEIEVISNPTPETLQHIYSLRRDMIFLRKSVWPLREVINVLERGEIQLIKKITQPQNERGHESVNYHCHNFYSPHLYRRDLWHEFPLYARIRMALELFFHIISHAPHRFYLDCLF
jgi:magnesium transporter